MPQLCQCHAIQQDACSTCSTSPRSTLISTAPPMLRDTTGCMSHLSDTTSIQLDISEQAAEWVADMCRVRVGLPCNICPCIRAGLDSASIPVSANVQCAGRGVLGGQHGRAGAGECAGAQQAAAGRRAHTRPGCAFIHSNGYIMLQVSALYVFAILHRCQHPAARLIVHVLRQPSTVLARRCVAWAGFGSSAVKLGLMARQCAASSSPEPWYKSPRQAFVHAGTGGNPELGEQAAQESYADLGEVVAGADMVSPLQSPNLLLTTRCSI